MLMARPVAALSLFLAFVGFASGQSQQREKVSEGQYQKYRNGKLTGEGKQSWSLWRRSDGGYDLENHFHLANATAELLGAMGSRHLSDQLRQEMEHEVSQTELDVKFSADFQMESLTVKGNRLLDGKAVVLETCVIAGQVTTCKGQSGSAKLNNHVRHEFLYSFPFPMLAVGILQHAATEVGVQVPMNLTVMELVPFDRSKVRLSSCRGLLTFLGDGQISLGEVSYKVKKYVLEVDSKTEPLKLTFLLNKRLVVAMEEARLPEERLQLVEYKKSFDF